VELWPKYDFYILRIRFVQIFKHMLDIFEWSLGHEVIQCEIPLLDEFYRFGKLGAAVSIRRCKSDFAPYQFIEVHRCDGVGQADLDYQAFRLNYFQGKLACCGDPGCVPYKGTSILSKKFFKLGLKVWIGRIQY